MRANGNWVEGAAAIVWHYNCHCHGRWHHSISALLVGRRGLVIITVANASIAPSYTYTYMCVTGGLVSEGRAKGIYCTYMSVYPRALNKTFTFNLALTPIRLLCQHRTHQPPPPSIIAPLYVFNPIFDNFPSNRVSKFVGESSNVLGFKLL